MGTSLEEGLSSSLFQSPDAPGKVRNVLVAALWRKLLQSGIQPEKVVPVQAAGPSAPEDVLRQRLRVLRPDKLVIVGRANVDEGADGRGAVRRLKGRVVDGVAVDFTNVEVLLDLGDLVGPYAVGDAPDSFGRRAVVVVRQVLPVGPLEESDDPAGRFGRAAVVLTKKKKNAGV